MSKYDSLAIVISFFCLWISSLLSDFYEIILGLLLILTFGIYHGANDILISSKLVAKRETNNFKILLYYIFQVFLALFIFFISPILGLILFVVTSSYHFGEQQLAGLKTIIPEKIIQFYYVSYGLMLFYLLFILHPNEVITIVNQITTYRISLYFIYNGFLFFMALFIFLTLWCAFKYKMCRKAIFFQFLLLGVFAIIFKVSSLIWGFAIYFIVWHSIPSIQLQTNFIYGSNSRINLVHYIKDAFLYWVLSVIAIGVFYYFLSASKLFVTIVFSFFSAITYPHAFVIFKMLQQKKTE